jgi:sugar/nucleoside kinase (ribokinase family)
MIVVLGDLLLDFSLRLASMSIEPKDLRRVTYLELGPGGATNVAIMARRLGMEVACLGEVGADRLGRMLVDSLIKEGIDVGGIKQTEGARTPVATVLVDERAEPAYLGYPGSLTLAALPQTWHAPITGAAALFCDGWVEYEAMIAVILQALAVARSANVPIFFDPGPGNPDVDNRWHLEAAALSTVVIATDAEGSRLTGHNDPMRAAHALLDAGPQLVILKRGPAGCLLLTPDGLEIAPGYPVEAVDATGAGDSFAAATIYGYLHAFDLPALGALANATGAAKVRKPGTGHNMPGIDEIRAVLAQFGENIPF